MSTVLVSNVGREDAETAELQFNFFKSAESAAPLSIAFFLYMEYHQEMTDMGQRAKQKRLRTRLAANPQCKVHPEYKAVRPPTSEHPKCTCQEMFDGKDTED